MEFGACADIDLLMFPLGHSRRFRVTTRRAKVLRICPAGSWVVYMTLDTASPESQLQEGQACRSSGLFLATHSDTTQR